MSVNDRKKRDSEKLKQNILNAAMRVFAEQGYEKISMRKIAALIDYSPTTIYRFFRNKEELLRTIAAETYGNLSARFEKIKSAAAGNPLAVLKSLIEEYVTFCVDQPDMFRLYSDLGSFEMENGVMYERLGETRFQVYQSWFECLRRSIESGLLESKDEARIFLYLWDSVNGYIDHRIAHPAVPRKPLAEDISLYLHLVFHGIENRASRPQAG